MTATDKMPKATNIPDLRINIEGLNRHSSISVFISEPSLSIEDRKLRAWLLHTITSAARHYSKARELVHLQNSDQQKDGGVVFYIFEVSEQIEDCIMATHRVIAALRRLNETDPENDFNIKYAESVTQLIKLRNQFEHMHNQIVSSQTGKGPIFMSFGDEGKAIQFRNQEIETTRLHELIECAFRKIASLYPAFDPNSAPEAGGPMKLTVTATVTVIDGNNEQQPA